LTAYVTTDQNQLISFDVRKPDQLLSIRNISGLPAGVSLVGIDFRPKTGDLYGIGSNSVVYRVNPQTAIAIAENVAPGTPPMDVPFTPGLNGTKFGIDFNPAPDAIRIVSDAQQNKRVTPDAGTTLGDDGNLNPEMPQVVGAAYTNSTFNVTQPAATAVQLYVLDRAQNQVCLQNPPNAGTLTMCQPLDDVRLGRDTGWDIAGSDDVGYLANNDRRGRATLYTVDETTGDTSNIGRRPSPERPHRHRPRGQPSELTPAHQLRRACHVPECSVNTAEDSDDHNGGAQSPNSRSVRTTHANRASGSTHRNVPDPPKWPKVRGEPSGAVQWGDLSPLSSNPSPQGLGS
jgi:hypothetical protein